MRKMLFAMICLSFFVACATGTQTQSGPQGINFETGRIRKTVMAVIVQVATDDGFTIGSVNQADGMITCKPRKMLDGVLSQKIEGGNWDIQTKHSTFNHLIQFSAAVTRGGVVELKTLVMISGVDSPVDRNKSEKLARYYEKKIMKILRTPRPKLL